jgi:integrase
MLARGVSITELSEYLGHSDEGFTLRTYTHFLPDSEGRARIAAIEAFRAIFQPSGGGERRGESA